VVVSTLVGHLNYIAEPKVNRGDEGYEIVSIPNPNRNNQSQAVVSADKTKLRTPGLESERIDMLSAETVFTFCLER
jgi:hypothetical protein